MLVDDQVIRAGAQDLQSLQELDDGPVVGDHPPRNRQGGLEDARRGDVPDRLLVLEPVSVRIGVAPEAFHALHAVMVVHGIVGELADRDHQALLVEGADH